MSLQLRLASQDPQIRSNAFVEVCRRASGLAKLDTASLSRAYRRISDGLIAAETGGEASGPRFTTADDLLVWGLVYGLRTFEVAARLLPSKLEGSWIELGAGCGPVSLLAAARGADARAIELSAPHVAWGRELAAAAGLKVDFVCGDALHTKPGANVVFPYSLREMMRGPAQRSPAKWLRSLAGQGQVLVIEPGTHSSSEWLRALRDSLDDLVVAPCPARGPCPMGAAASDWCHFTWNIDAPPEVMGIYSGAGRRHQEAHLSYFHLSSLASKAGGHRVLSSRAAGKAKWRLDLCAQGGGAGVITALARHEEACAALKACPSHAMVSWEREAVEAKGDGLRLVDAAGFRGEHD